MTDMLHHSIQLRDVTTHYITAGTGTPVLLLHGWPQTSYTWRHVIPLLAERHTVIAPDLRGLGESSVPESGYDKLTIAGDVQELMTALGYTSWDLVGHDWGGVVAFLTAAAFPPNVRRLAIVDVVVPGLGTTRIDQGGKRWHHGFHRTPVLPERLVEGNEAAYLGWFFTNFGATKDAISDHEMSEYLRTYSEPARLHAGFEYYRATARDELDVQRLTTGAKLDLPVLAIGGGRSWGRGGDVGEALDEAATRVETMVFPDCGHWIPEEDPQLLARELLRFFGP